MRQLPIPGLEHCGLTLCFRILSLTKTKQKDKQISAVLEKKTRAETEARLSIEKQLAELQAHKLEEAAILARSSLPNRYGTHSLTFRHYIVFKCI